MIRQNRLENSSNSTQYKAVHWFDLVFGLSGWPHFNCFCGPTLSVRLARWMLLELLFMCANANANALNTKAWAIFMPQQTNIKYLRSPLSIQSDRESSHLTFTSFECFSNIFSIHTYSLNGKSTWGRLLPRADMIIRIITAAGNSRICKWHRT